MDKFSLVVLAGMWLSGFILGMLTAGSIIGRREQP